MEEEIQRYREAKLMEPIFRMYKVIAEKDELKAQTFMAVVVQYVTEHFNGVRVSPNDVQNVIRAVLLQDEDGTYYSMYVFNEIQVKTAEWITILAADLNVTLEELGKVADRIAISLEDKVCVSLLPEDVVAMMEAAVVDLDPLLMQRIQLNQDIYLRDLASFLANSTIKH